MKANWSNAGTLGIAAGLAAILSSLPTALSTEEVSFQVSVPNEEVVALTADLTIPTAAGPLPAVVLLHGCGGVLPNWGDVWAEQLHQWGYVTLQVDSFSPRGDLYATPEKASLACHRFQTASPWTRAYDAHAARDYLSGLPFVDPDRIAVMGQSHGGDATLWAVSRHPRYVAEWRGTGQFAAAIALYPYCFDVLHGLDAPLLILVGALDNSTPAYRCERMRLEGNTTHDLQLKIYPSAYHAFDVDAPQRVVVGQRMAYDAAATEDARRQVRGFLDEYLD